MVQADQNVVTGKGSADFCLTEKKHGRSLLVLPLAFYLLIIVKDGWLSDDSYITLRVVYNFIHGYGLTWNTDERVQAYTHPLWMFCLSLIYFFTHEAYYSTLLLSIIISFIAVALLSFYLARSTLLATLGILVLAASKSFVDFSTSGLENPLSYLLIVVFMIVFYQTRGKKQSLWWLALIAGLAILNRMDTLLLFLPTLIIVFCQFPGWKSVKTVVLGFTPFICWEIFSLCYYGFLFPNTAYAKLDTGVSSVQLLLQGIGYLISSFTFDPLILIVMGASVVLLLQQRAWKDLPVLLGMGLYLLYTVKIGGDFMAGRFLTEPFLIAVILLVHTTFPVSKLNVALAVAIVLLFILVTPNSRWYPLINYNILIDQRGVADERDYYVNETGILNVLHTGPWPNSQMVKDALQAKQSGQKVVISYNIGIFGFTTGPSVHIVDLWALSDPLLARLPTQPGWRIGHFERAIPVGYIKTLESGQNVIIDKQLALYYSKLQEVTRGPLFDIQRWIDIWKLNTGAYNYLLDPCLSSCPSKTL